MLQSVTVVYKNTFGNLYHKLKPNNFCWKRGIHSNWQRGHLLKQVARSFLRDNSRLRRYSVKFSSGALIVSVVPKISSNCCTKWWKCDKTGTRAKLTNISTESSSPFPDLRYKICATSSTETVPFASLSVIRNSTTLNKRRGSNPGGDRQSVASSFWRDYQRTGTIISTTPVHGLKF